MRLVQQASGLQDVTYLSLDMEGADLIIKHLGSRQAVPSQSHSWIMVLQFFTNGRTTCKLLSTTRVHSFTLREEPVCMYHRYVRSCVGAMVRARTGETRRDDETSVTTEESV